MDQNLGGTDTPRRVSADLHGVAGERAERGARAVDAGDRRVPVRAGPGFGEAQGDVLEKLATAAWYLHSNRDGKLFFRNVENLTPSSNAWPRRTSASSRLRSFANGWRAFKPTNGWCYQDVSALPAIDEIKLCPTVVA